MKTFSAKPADLQPEWLLIDANNLVLGRLASHIARLVRGKHKPMFTPHMNCGDKVIVINAEKVATTGNKLLQNKFFWHTGYIGGIKERTWEKILSSKHPEELLINAVRRMLPKDSPLARDQLAHNLFIYAGSEHPHQAQQPKTIDITTLNNKILKRDTNNG